MTSGQVIAAAPITIAGTWNDGFGSPTFDTVAGEDVRLRRGDEATWRVQERRGDGLGLVRCRGHQRRPRAVRVSRFGDKVLALSGPASVKTGETATLKVTDAATGAAVAGAKVGSATSAADGTVTAGPWSDAGVQDFKAEQTNFVRSNRVRVTVTAADAPPATVIPFAADGRARPHGADGDAAAALLAPVERQLRRRPVGDQDGQAAAHEAARQALLVLLWADGTLP